MGLISNVYAAGIDHIPHTVPMIIASAAIVYFTIFRPSYKQQKQLTKLIENLQVKDRIKLSCGIVGNIQKIGDKHLLLEIAENVSITVDKSSVLEVMS